MSESKLEYFAEAINREISARKIRAKHQLANDLSQHAAAEISAAENRVNDEIEKARRKIARDTNKKIAAATAREKATHFATRDSRQAQLLEAVAQDLREFVNSDEYENYLAEQIEAAKAKFPFAAEVIRDPEGGFILQSENGKIRADHTFRTRLQAKGLAN
jgi:predicted house-cleaning noncanonical NTP pyrophosphatase (MazG superfamily)